MQTDLPRVATRALVAAAAVMAAACASLANDAKTRFAAEYFCPSDLVTVVERVDLYRPFVIPAYEMPPPPAEVQADPRRLALYVEEANKRRSPEQTVSNPESFYEVQGCGHRTIFRCAPDRRKSGTCIAVP